MAHHVAWAGAWRRSVGDLAVADRDPLGVEAMGEDRVRPKIDRVEPTLVGAETHPVGVRTCLPVTHRP